MTFECFLGVSPEDCAVPPKSDLAHVTQLATLDFLTSKSTRADFVFDDAGLLFQVEAHAPGVYRLRCGKAEILQNDKPSSRTKAHAEMLVARQVAVGELAISSIAEPAQYGWRLEQGDIAMEILRSPFQISVYRGEHCIFSSQADATLSRGEQADAAVWRFGAELD